MAQNDDSAPDLKILGDKITLQPSGYIQPEGQKQDEKEEALMRHVARFRSDPLQFLREVSLYVSGSGWRAYDHVIGQPIFYPAYTEHVKSQILSAPLLQSRVGRLAERRLAVEEAEGLLDKAAPDYVIRRGQRRSVLERGLQEVAEQMADDMICKFESKTFIRGAYYLTTQFLLRAYHQGIHVSSEEILRLRKVAEDAERRKLSLIFLPCHRSHVDYVSLQLICYRLGVALPIVVAGENLNIPVLGPFLQHAGAMWIRRSFGDDVLYTTVVQTYIDTLLREGYNFECFIEGGRSRTGKLLSPKFGILSFVLDSLLSGRVDDAIVCPVSTQYDKVLETEGYVTELLGVPKKRENLADFVTGGSSALSLRLGRVDVRFHEPWSLRGFIDEQLTRLGFNPSGPSPFAEPDARGGGNGVGDMSGRNSTAAMLRQKLLRTLGYTVLSNINSVSVVMPTALIGTVLLTLRGRGVGKGEMIRRVEWLTDRVRAKGGRVAHFGVAPLSDIIDRGLEVLGRDLVGVVDGLLEPTYFAVDRFQLSFYRNMTIHLFIYEALVSAAMYTRVKQGGGPAMQDIDFPDLRAQVLFFSTLFRGEFIFAGDGLDVNLDKTLRGLEADGIIYIEREMPGTAVSRVLKLGLSDAERRAGRENFDFYCFLIWPFIESTWLAAVSLMGLSPARLEDEETWIELSKTQNSAQLLGKTLYHQGDLSYLEAVNKETLRNSYQRFEEEGIIHVAKSHDARIPARLRLAADWRARRDPNTNRLVPEGRLWDFTEKIARGRREGKNRRDGATVSTRVLRLTDELGARLFEAVWGRPSHEEEEGAKRRADDEKSRRRMESRANL